MKHCNKCDRTLPRDQFNRHSKNKDGLQPVCRECGKDYSKAGYQRRNVQDRIRHKAWRTAALNYVHNLKNNPCMDCGGRFHPVCMDFDHRDPIIKTRNIASMVGRCSLDTIKTEIAKCDLVCSNCHRLRTYNVPGSVLG